MLIRAEELSAQTMEKPRGGTGTAYRLPYDAACGIKGEITNFAVMSLSPNSSIGLHQHVGDMEYYLILDGTPKALDNGEEHILSSGDLLVTKDGDEHSLINDTEKLVTFVAIIVKH